MKNEEKVKEIMRHFLTDEGFDKLGTNIKVSFENIQKQ